MKVVHSSHVSVMHRHTVEGTDVVVFREPTITFVGARDELGRIRGAKAGAHSVVFDHQRRTAQHGTHLDPAIIIDAQGHSFLQVFLCDADPEESFTKVGVVLDDGSVVALDTVRHRTTADDGIDTEVSRTDGVWRVEVEGRSVTPIWQHSSYGVERETLGPIVSGRGRVAVPALFSDRLGLCLTTEDLFGGIEHKHLFHGEAGHPSGRWLYSGGNLHMPRARKMPAYRSLVLDLTGDGRPSADVVMGFDEVQAYCHPMHEDAARLAYGRYGVPLDVVTVSESEEDEPDLLLVDARQMWRPTVRPVSLLLFADQNEPDWADRLQASLALFARLPEEVPVLEAAWFGETGIVPEPGNRHYGVGFSQSSADFPRGMIDLTKRVRLPDRIMCGTCEYDGRCMDLLATPWARPAQPGPEGCGVKNALEHIVDGRG
jgi:hypothetical protein